MFQFQQWLQQRRQHKPDHLIPQHQPREDDWERERRKQREAELEREWGERVQRIEDEFSIHRGER
jgi:hypothetical protein